MKKYLVILSIFTSLLVFSSQSAAGSYNYYKNVVDQKMGKAAEKNKAIVSYEYSNGILIVLTRDGKLDLKDGIYKMDNGETFYVEKGAVVKHEEAKKKDKKDKKDKLKGLM